MLLKESTPEWIASESMAELEENKKQINFTAAMPILAINARITALIFVFSSSFSSALFSSDIDIFLFSIISVLFVSDYIFVLLLILTYY